MCMNNTTTLADLHKYNMHKHIKEKNIKGRIVIML